MYTIKIQTKYAELTLSVPSESKPSSENEPSSKAQTKNDKSNIPPE